MAPLLGSSATANGDGIAGNSDIAASYTEVQNSQNLGWAGAGFAPSADGLYDFMLSAYDDQGAP